MRWELLQVKDLSKAIHFIGENEWICEHLFTRLLKKNRLKSIEPDQIWMGYKNDKPQAILYISNQGLLLPYLPFLEETPFLLEVFTPVKEALSDKAIRIYSILGKLQYVEAMEKLFRFNRGFPIDYHLMTRSKNVPLPPPPILPHLHIRKATLEDLDCILPLQVLYEKEEVLIQPEMIEPEKTRSDLSLALREQYIFLGEYEGTAVTKAGTNARGILYDQIGGVFTDPKYRGKHFAKALMVRLLQQIHGEGKNACLFVKVQNRVAIHLYEELGFQIQESFRIHYL